MGKFEIAKIKGSLSGSDTYFWIFPETLSGGLIGQSMVSLDGKYINSGRNQLMLLASIVECLDNPMWLEFFHSTREVVVGNIPMSKNNKNNNNGSKLDLGALSSHLWEAANILRGPVDAADFKTYIFPLLFFKRVSDVFDEEFIEALTESRGDLEFARFPENHRFQIPEGCHWKVVRAKNGNIGHALQTAMRCIEQANPDTLHGIFGDAQ